MPDSRPTRAVDRAAIVRRRGIRRFTCVYTDLRTGDAPPASGAGSRSELAHAALKRRLLMGEFPLGDRLGEERLATLLEVSRTPVREALARLHAEALVERHPEGGYRPSPPDLHTTAELYQVRLALELHAVALPGRDGVTHDRGALRALHDDWVEMSSSSDLTIDPGFVLLDEDFHVRLAASAGNRALVDNLVAVNERIRPVRMHDFLTAERVGATVEQHIGIVDALVAGDADFAGQRLEAHLRQSLDVVQLRAGEALSRMVRAGRTAGAPR